MNIVNIQWIDAAKVELEDTFYLRQAVEDCILWYEPFHYGFNLIVDTAKIEELEESYRKKLQ
jgi:hypothetical protein